MLFLSVLSLTWLLLQNVILNVWVCQISNSQLNEVLLNYGVPVRAAVTWCEWGEEVTQHLILRAPRFSGQEQQPLDEPLASLDPGCVSIWQEPWGGSMLSFGRILNWESDGLDFSPNPALSLLSNLEWAHINILHFYIFSGKVGLR